MENMTEYVVTLKDKNSLDEFYNDMRQKNCRKKYIPKREINSCKKRKLSRNTHYYLTAEEAEELKKDRRVLDVAPVQLILDTITPLWEQNSIWDRSTAISSNYKNWGLKRCTLTENINNWGNAFGQNPQDVSPSSTDLNGNNVDIIIIDGHINPQHPEFAVNQNGTGGSRVVQFNWFSLNSVVDELDDDNSVIPQSSTYVYPPYADVQNAARTVDNNHGCHVAGIAAGNTHGWARKSNIYNINPYSTNVNGTFNSLLLWDYIRAFHREKPVNPLTGRKNPTICNCSFGYILRFPFNGSFVSGPITSATYRGSTVANQNGLTYEQLIQQKIYRAPSISTVTVPYYIQSISADIQDAIDDGIIVVGAAGNESFRVTKTGDVDYNNSFSALYNGFTVSIFYHRGTAPSAVPSVICVGSSSSVGSEYKSDSSNCGNRIDLFAPGQNIISSVNSISGESGASDPRDSNYKIVKISGTSMASPQVAGVVACILERYPNFTQQDVSDYLLSSAKKTVLNNQSDDASDTTSLQGAENNMLYYNNERIARGNVSYPPNNVSPRKQSGISYPRNI